MFRQLTLLLSVIFFVSVFFVVSLCLRGADTDKSNGSKSVSHAPLPGRNPQQTANALQQHMYTQTQQYGGNYLDKTRWPRISVCCGYKLKSHLIKEPYTESLPLQSAGADWALALEVIAHFKDNKH